MRTASLEPLRRLLTLLLLACCLGPARAAPAVVLLEDEMRQPLGHAIETFLDESGTLDLQALQQWPGLFAPPASTAPAVGYHPGTLWVRFELRNVGTLPLKRWLVMGWPFQESARLYLVGTDGVDSVQHSGSTLPLALRPLPSRTLLFNVEVGPGQTRTAYLALAGRTATMVHLALWQPAAWADAVQRQATLQFLAVGSTLVVVAFCAIAWRVSRQGRLLLGGVGHLLLVLQVLLLDGWAADVLPLDAHLWQNRWLQVLTFLAAACQLGFARSFLEVARHHPRRARLLDGAALMALVLAAVPLLGFVPAFGAVGSVSFSLMLAATAWTAHPHAGPAGRAYLLACALWLLPVSVRSGQLLGALPQLPFMPNLPVWGLLLSSLALSYALYLRVRDVGERAEAAQRCLIEQQHTEQERLRVAVERQTQELLEATSRAEEASHAKSAFLSMMSHELRAPLHTVLGYTRLMQRDVPPAQRPRLALIERSGEQLLQRIERILSFSRGESMAEQVEPAPLALRALLLQLVEDNQPLAERQRNRLQLQFHEQVPACVEADGQRLLQVLQNLVGNACKYCHGAVIELGVYAFSQGQDERGVVHQLCFEVRDTGPGIPQDEQQRIFEPFNRLPRHRHRPGVGLGLAIARQLVQAMGGDIAIDSRPGQGSRFHFELWLRELDAALLRHGAHAPEPVHHLRLGPRRRLLMVDDDPENLRLLQELCGRWGFDAVTADDGAAALAHLRRKGHPVDAVLVDQFMPGMDGWTLLRVLRASPATVALPVLLLSASAPVQPPNWPSGIGFDAILTKPFTPSALSDALGRLLNLEWAHAPPREEPSAPWPPAQELHALAGMVALGQVPAIVRWSEELALRQPACGEWLSRVRQCCAVLDLAGLQRLLAQAGLPAAPAMQADASDARS